MLIEYQNSTWRKTLKLKIFFVGIKKYIKCTAFTFFTFEAEGRSTKTQLVILSVQKDKVYYYKYNIKQGIHSKVFYT